MSDRRESQPFDPDQTDHASEDESSRHALGGVEEMPDGVDGLGPKTLVGVPSDNAPPFTGENDATIIQISNTFHLNANLDILPPNVIFVSSDQLFFAVHHFKLIDASLNDFGQLLLPGIEPTVDEPLTLGVPEVSDVLNVVLHCVYGLSCDTYQPSFECLTASVAALEKYGLPPSRYLARNTPLFNTFLTYAALLPLETYTLAASHSLEDLAVTASSYTLNVKVHNIPLDMAAVIGTKYLQRLHHLHASRMEGLKALLDEKLYPHVAKPHCSIEQRQVVSRAYQLAGAQVYYTATPAISRPGIEMVMEDLVKAVDCPDCKESLVAHIDALVKKWVMYKRTI